MVRSVSPRVAEAFAVLRSALQFVTEILRRANRARRIGLTESEGFSAGGGPAVPPMAGQAGGEPINAESTGFEPVSSTSTQLDKRSDVKLSVELRIPPSLAGPLRRAQDSNL